LPGFPETRSSSRPRALFADISTEMLYPVLPVFLTHTLKATGSFVGLVDGFA